MKNIANENRKKVDKNTGTPENQIKFFTEKIQRLNKHMGDNKHDYVTKLSLEKIINKRKKMLKYLKKNSEERFKNALSIIK